MTNGAAHYSRGNLILQMCMSDLSYRRLVCANPYSGFITQYTLERAKHNHVSVKLSIASNECVYKFVIACLKMYS